ncbi:MAG: DUF4190 domain-containing protein [Desulfomonilaceae bacterium]|nr:DUF4190 domain-containing protein [Desulfomonilaceae bacterium]
MNHPPNQPEREPFGTSSHPGRTPRPVPANHADLVLAFGILSLFLCVPLGIIAWIMGSSDLRKIRAGIMPPVKVRFLKAGRALGIIGTALFPIAFIFGAAAIHHGPWLSSWPPREFEGLVRPNPLSPAHMSFAGEWYGNQGTVIRIRPDGTGDFESVRTTLTGGRVNIREDSLSIGLFGLARTWHIDRRPHVKDGMWIMELDGEEFERQVEGLLVRGSHEAVGTS